MFTKNKVYMQVNSFLSSKTINSQEFFFNGRKLVRVNSRV